MNKFWVVFCFSLFVVACSTTPLPDTNKGAPVETRGDGSRVTPIVAGVLDANGLPRELTDPKSRLSQRSVYFALDSYDIRDEYRNLISDHAKFLKANIGFKILIQGNTDERGSREYNLSLGQKRAEAVRRALSLLGISDDQTEAVSLGEEKPKNTGHGEESWSENRRADILYRATDGRGEF